MKKLLTFLVMVSAVTSVLVFCKTPIHCAIPHLINYQGMLTNDLGDPLSGPHNLTFRIYDDTTGGELEWSETQNGVQVEQGLFNVILGQVTLLDLAFDEQYWLEVQVDSDTMPERLQFTSVGYAYRARVADTAAVAVSAPTGGGWVDDGSVVRLQTSTDKVGIGTTSPQAGLHLKGAGWPSSFMYLQSDSDQDAGIRFYEGGDVKWHIFNSSPDGGLRIYNSNASKTVFFAKQSSGNVGIGTVSPQDRVEVVDGNVNARLCHISHISFPSPYDAYSGVKGTYGEDVVGFLGYRHYFSIGGNTYYGVYGSATTSGRNYGVYGYASGGSTNWAGFFTGDVHASGKVGIGTITPGVKLHIDGGSDVKDNTQNSGYLIIGTSTGQQIAIDNNEIMAKASGTTVGDLYIQNSEQAKTIIGGKVGIGTTSPSEKLDVVGTVKCQVLKLTGGSDIAEPFDVKGTDVIKAGMVLTIDPENPGKLRISEKAYDRCVAGIISGAGSIEPGMLMGQSGSVADGEYPVALTGRVYCWADASNGSIQPGDLLTTSDTPGHAMRVTDYARSQGAVIGKVMSSLGEGQGLVLVLVTLQ